jgi:hypothetical protein
VAQDSNIDNRMDELLKNARSADKIDRERAELFTAMIKTPAWIEYVSLLNMRLQGFADQVLSPSGSVDAMIGLEYVKGTMSGLVIARDLPSVTIAAMDQLRRGPVEPAEEIDDAG